MESIHKARIFDIAAGLGVSLESSIVTVNSRSLTLLKRAKESFRGFIDSATPSIYVIDMDTEVVNPLVSSFNLSVSSEVLKAEILEAISKIISNISTKEFVDIVETANKKANDKLEVLKQGNATHLDYRNVFYTLGKDISVLFNTRVNLLVSDPENLGLAGKYVFIGKSFEGIKGNINKAINSILRKYTTDSKASYGNIMAAGHTSVRLAENTYGTNTPATQEALFKLEAAGSSNSSLLKFDEFTDTFVKKVPLFLNSTITFNENFTPVAKNLLNIGFTFVVPMNSIVNSASGATEVRAIKDLIGNTVVPGIAEAMKSRLTWLKTNALGIRGSPSIPEYITSLILAAIKGEKPTSSVYTDIKKAKIKLPDLDIAKIKLKVAKKVQGVKVRNVAPKPQQTSQVNLSSLMVLINRHLQSVISANMGDGAEHKILNYRTGRFAASAAVERMSESRAGMITAFYSYMKNPYQTFEPGYKQGSPASRDPKLLISKSIREIAATRVGARLRAVSA